MNKKFTMMLAAFVAAGYTITAEAGVVKVSKPVSGGTYYITNAAGNLFLSSAGLTAGDEAVLKAQTVTLATLDDNGELWKLSGTESSTGLTGGSILQLSGDVETGDGFAIKDVQEKKKPVLVSEGLANGLQITGNSVKTGGVTPYYLEFPAVEGVFGVQGTEEKTDIAFYAKTTEISGKTKTLLIFGGEYLVVDPTDDSKLTLVNEVEYSRLKNPTTWDITNGVAKIHSEVSGLRNTAADCLKIEGTEFKLVDATSASVLSEYEGNLMVSNSGAAARYVSFANGQPSLAEEEPVENGVGSSTITPGADAPTADDLVLPTVTLPQGVSPIADWTEESFSLVAINSDNHYTLKAKDGRVTVKEASENISGNSFFWKYTKEDSEQTGSLKSLDGTPFATDGAYIYELIESNSTPNVFFLYTESKGYVQFDGTTLKYAKDNSDATAFAAQAVAMMDVSAAELAEKALGSFSLTYKIDNKEVANLFSNVTAIDVNVSGYANGTYFVVNAPDNLPEALTAEVLKELTFVAISPVKSSDFVYNDASYDNGAGYTLTTVKGDDLVEVENSSKDDIAFENVAFKVKRSQSDSKFEKLTIAPAGSFYVNGTDDEANLQERKNDNVVIAAIKAKGGSTFVSTFNVNDNTEDKIQATQTAALTPATAVKYSDFLGTEAKIYNIQFLSTTAAPASATTSEAKETYSECNKYLGAGEAANEFLAQGADFVDLSLPQNQWVVSNMTEDNVVTFTNRETAKSFSAKLIKIADNEYRLAGFTSDSDVKYLYLNTNDEKVISTDLVYDNDDAEVNNFIVKLTSVTASKNDGYVSGALSENDMVKIAFTPTSSVVVNDLYLTISGTTPKTGLNVEGAAEFEVIKTAQKTKTAAHVTPIAVLKDGKPVVSTTVADTLNVVTYAFKYVKGDDTYFLANTNFDVENKEEAEKNNQFIIKKLNNGKLALVAYTNASSSVKDFDESITNVRMAFDADLEDSETRFVYTHNLYSATTEPDAYISFVGQDAAISLPAKSQHVLFNNEGAYMAVNENNAAVIDGPSELKAEYTKEQLTFWLDTTDSEAIVPTFYITKGSKQFMFNAIDSLSRYNEGTASAEEVKAYMMPDNDAAARAIFRAATLKDSDTLTTSIKGESKDLTAEKGIEAYQYKIVLKDKAVADEYVVRSVKNGYYMYESNGALGFTDDAKKAIVFTIESTEAPTSNEGVSASDVKVVAQNGSVVVMNAAGKNVVVSTILGQVVVNEVLTSDNATINVPAGIVVVAVEGESFKVNVK